MTRISRYSLSLLLLILLISPANAQVDVSSPDAGMRVRGPRIGIDLASLALLYFDPGRMIYTLSVDYEALQDIYPVVEIGYQSVNIETDNYNYGSNGMFARIGVDVNILNYDQNNIYEMFYAGFRYGISYFTHQADNISIPDDYFNGLSGGFITKNQLNAHWIAAVGGVRVELFDNFFMGWSVQANLKLVQSKDDNMDPYNVPGFGKGNKRTGVIINYTLAYRIPMQTYKPRKIIKRKDPAAESEYVPLQE